MKVVHDLRFLRPLLLLSSFSRSRAKKAGPWKQREIIGIPNRSDYVAKDWDR